MTVLRLRAGTATVLGVVLGLTGALAAAALVAVAGPAVQATGCSAP